MRIFIFGGNGMAGHMLKNYFQSETPFEVFYTVRNGQKTTHCIPLNILDKENVIAALEEIRPEIVINAVGILNDQAMNNPLEAIYVNSLFPHQLKQYGKALDFRLIHISTDCVFSGKKGSYIEADITDGLTAYAKTKALGEIDDNENITIRTSIIGPELKSNGIGLFHWFMKQQREIQGYKNVFWNGVTTLELAKAVQWLIQHPLNGIIHLTAPMKTSKYDLLMLFKNIFNPKVEITPCEEVISDKTLINTRPDFSYTTLPYPDMIQELYKWMKKESSLYNAYL